MEVLDYDWQNISFDELTPNLMLLVYVFGGAVGSFFVVFCCFLPCKSRHEIGFLSRCIQWAKLTCTLLLFVNVFFLLMTAWKEREVVSPYFGVARPILGLVLCGTGFVAYSHPCLRWTFCLGQTLLVFLDAVSEVWRDFTIACRQDGTCKVTEGFDVDELQMMVYGGLAAMALEIWSILIVFYLIPALGCCGSKIPPRMFSTTHPYSVLPVQSSEGVKGR